MISCGRKNKSFHTAEFQFFTFWDSICFIFSTWSDESFEWTIGTNDEIIFMDELLHTLIHLKFKGGSQPIISYQLWVFIWTKFYDSVQNGEIFNQIWIIKLAFIGISEQLSIFLRSISNNTILEIFKRRRSTRFNFIERFVWNW